MNLSTNPKNKQDPLEQVDLYDQGGGLSYAINPKSKTRVASYNPQKFGQNLTGVNAQVQHLQKRNNTAISKPHNKVPSTDIGLIQQMYQQQSFQPRAASSTVTKNQAIKKTQLQNKQPPFQSKYLEKQQPKIKNKLQNLIGEVNGSPVVPVHDHEGNQMQQFEQWQRPPSRQKEPNRAQNLDDTDPNGGDRNVWRTQQAIHNNSAY